MSRSIEDAKAWINGGWRNSKYAQQINYPYGKHWVLNTDGQAGAQCKDLVNAYASYLGHPFTAGNAESLWSVAQDPFWERVPASRKPKVGDVFVMWYQVDGVEFGHTGVVTSVGANNFKSLDQNWSRSSLTVGSPPAKVTHPMTAGAERLHSNYDIRGYLRPSLGEEMYKGKTAQYWYKEAERWKKRAQELDKGRSRWRKIAESLKARLGGK